MQSNDSFLPSDRLHKIIYTLPLPNLHDKLQTYACFIGNRVYAYGQKYGYLFEDDDAVKSATKNRQMSNPYKRISLSNSGSVLQHICALLCLQLEQSEDYKQKAKKCHSLDTFTLIKEHDFRYSENTVETVRKSKEKSLKASLSSLFKLKT